MPSPPPLSPHPHPSALVQCPCRNKDTTACFLGDSVRYHDFSAGLAAPAASPTSSEGPPATPPPPAVPRVTPALHPTPTAAAPMEAAPKAAPEAAPAAVPPSPPPLAAGSLVYSELGVQDHSCPVRCCLSFVRSSNQVANAKNSHWGDWYQQKQRTCSPAPPSPGKGQES